MMNRIPQKISFDYDGTLDSHLAIQELVSLYLAAGKQVFILTSRPPEPYRNQDLFAMADKVGIPRTSILFAWETNKSYVIQQNSIDLHFDNDPHAINEIYHACGPHVGILVHYKYTSGDIYDE
jgi:hypothetical protein